MSRFGDREPMPVLVAEGAEYEGLISFRGSLRLDGKVRGAVRGTGHLFLAETASITGPVEVDSLQLEGRIEGEVTVGKLAVLAPAARLAGALRAASLRLEEGAELRACPLDVGFLRS